MLHRLYPKLRWSELIERDAFRSNLTVLFFFFLEKILRVSSFIFQ